MHRPRPGESALTSGVAFAFTEDERAGIRAIEALGGEVEVMNGVTSQLVIVKADRKLKQTVTDLRFHVVLDECERCNRGILRFVVGW